MSLEPQAAAGILDLITGGWRAQALYTAVKMRLPDHIEAGRITLGELSQATGAKEDGLRRLMRLLVALGVIAGGVRQGYRNTPLGAAVLDRPGSMRDMCLLYGEEFYAAWGHAHEAICTLRAGFEIAYGKPLYGFLGEHQDASDRFQRAMKAGNLFFDDVAGVFDFCGRRVVDLGGGNGQLLAAILSAAPDARGTLLELEHVLPTARDNLAASVESGRVELVAGDMFRGVPVGGDVYVLCRVLAGHSDEAVRGLFENIRRAMAGPASRLLLLDRLVVDEGSTVLPALWDLHLLMTTGGRHRSLAELRALLDRAGLEIERSSELPMETTALIARAQLGAHAK